MELAKDFYIPITADSVLSPTLHYGDPLTAIYFITEEDMYGRITFEKLDSIKVSRGEYSPYEYKSDINAPYCWVKIVENSNWLKERFNYEYKYYGDSYEFNGDVDDMKSDYQHYIFNFHDEFIEAIAAGLWYEQDSSCLFGKELSSGHPFLPITETNIIRFEAYGLTCQARINNKSKEELSNNSVYCSQKLIEFALELENITVNYTLNLRYKNNKQISSLNSYFGSKVAEFDKIANLDDAKPFIELYMKEVSERRKAMNK